MAEEIATEQDGAHGREDRETALIFATQEARAGGRRDCHHLRPGCVIDNRYAIVSEIGSGGFATVYKAHHIMLDRDVAIKVMDSAGNDPTYVERFFREARIAAKLDHPHSVTIYDFGIVADLDVPYMAMELLEGRDLYAEIYETHGIRPLTPRRAFRLMRPVLEALGVGHKRGIVHKDLKPENLFIIDPGTDDEMMKVVDFGVARMESAGDMRLTVNGNVTGTPRFMAPEYILNQQVTPAIDVYQMALIFSEAITCHGAVCDLPIEAMTQHAKGRIEIADFLQRGRLREVFLKALSIDPARRYGDCEEFGRALDEVAEAFDVESLLDTGTHVLGTHVSLSEGVEDEDNLGDLGREASGDVKASEVPTAVLAPFRAVQRRDKIMLALIVAMGVSLIVLFVLIGFVWRAQSTRESSAPQLPRASHDALAFSITTSPAARITLFIDEGPVVFCTTPCQRSLTSEELPIHVSYAPAEFEAGALDIDEGLYRKTQGAVLLHLTRKPPAVEAPAAGAAPAAAPPPGEVPEAEAAPRPSKDESASKAPVRQKLRVPHKKYRDSSGALLRTTR